jgi:hypothetical protein
MKLFLFEGKHKVSNWLNLTLDRDWFDEYLNYHGQVWHAEIPDSYDITRKFLRF